MSDPQDQSVPPIEEWNPADITDENRPYLDLIRHMRAFAEASPIDAFEIASIVIDQIANATTPEEIFAANESGPADMEEYLNRPIGLTRIQLAPVAEKWRKGSLGYYVVMNAICEGEKIVVSTGAPNVVASTFRFNQLNFIKDEAPFYLVVRGRETPNGTLYTVHAA